MTTQKTERDALIEAVEESAYDWTRYVEADSAPHTLSIHLAPSIAAVKAAMDAQALRIGELEKNAEADAFLIALANDNAARLLVERDTLRAQIAAIAATEPVAWQNAVDGYSLMTKQQKETNEFQYSEKFLADHTVPLFTRPMPAQPAQDVNAELVTASRTVSTKSRLFATASTTKC